MEHSTILLHSTLHHSITATAPRRPAPPGAGAPRCGRAGRPWSNNHKHNDNHKSYDNNNNNNNENNNEADNETS